MRYMSVNSAKSARARYIRVAAIDIIVNEGTWNIYVTLWKGVNDLVSTRW